MCRFLHTVTHTLQSVYTGWNNCVNSLGHFMNCASKRISSFHTVAANIFSGVSGSVFPVLAYLNVMFSYGSWHLQYQPMFRSFCKDYLSLALSKLRSNI